MEARRRDLAWRTLSFVMFEFTQVSRAMRGELVTEDIVMTRYA